MAAFAFSAVGSPPHGEDLNPVQDWELLSASTLLAQGHGLGFGLPPLTTPGLHTSLIEDDAVSRRDADSDAELGFIFRSRDGTSLPLDVSQIAVVCSTSSSTVEPFTEGWKPQFRIAGAALQEDYYAPDPFAPAVSNTGRSVEPFLDMEHSFLIEPPMTANDETGKRLLVDIKQDVLPADYAERCFKDAASQKKSIGDDLAVQEEGIENLLGVSDIADLSKAIDRNNCIAKNVRLRRKGQGFFKRKSYVIWSVAITTALLGVFFITYCSHSEHNDLIHELSAGDE